MASTTSWDESVPSGTSSIAQGDDEIRSLKSFVRSWISQEHYTTDGSSTSAGEHKVGSARAYQAATSALSNPRIGALFHATDNNQLYVASGSSWSAVDGVGINSVHTWTAEQIFSAGVDIGGNETLHELNQGKFALAQVVLPPSTGTVKTLDTGGQGLNNPSAVAPLQLARDEQVVTALSYNSTDGYLVLQLFNTSSSTVTVSAQSVYVSSMSFI